MGCWCAEEARSLCGHGTTSGTRGHVYTGSRLLPLCTQGLGCQGAPVRSGGCHAPLHTSLYTWLYHLHINIPLPRGVVEVSGQPMSVCSVCGMHFLLSVWVLSFEKGAVTLQCHPHPSPSAHPSLSLGTLHLGVLHSFSMPEAIWPSSSVVLHPPRLALPHITCCLIGFKLMGNHDLQPYLCPQHNVQTCRCPGSLGGKPWGLHRHLRLLHLPGCGSSTVPTPATL